MLAAPVDCHFVVQVFEKLPDDGILPLLPFAFPVTCTIFGVKGVVDLTPLNGGDTGPALSQPLGEVSDQVVGKRPNRATNAGPLDRHGEAALPGLCPIRLRLPQFFPHLASRFSRTLQGITTRQTASPTRSNPQKFLTVVEDAIGLVGNQ